MSVINRDEALRAKDIAESLMNKKDFTAARKLAAKAQKMDPSLENISRMMMVCDVHCAATSNLFGNEMDWYGILQVEVNASDITIKKQYRRLALLLHPDKNKLPGAESAFKLIGEAQRILLDKDSRMQHDNKRKTWRKPAPAPSYKPQQVPNYRTQQASVNIRNVFNEMKPENMYPQQKAQAQPAGFSQHSMFQNICPYCRSSFTYFREKEIICGSCKKPFTAFGTSFQSVPLSKNSSQTTFSVPQQNKFPAQKATNEPPAVPSRKASFPASGSAAENNNKKRKRKNTVESSESSDSDSSSESENTINENSMASQDLGSNGGQQPRRSVRSKRQVSYNENLSDDDVDVATDNGKGSHKNIDTEREEEPKDEKQTHEDHHSTETLPNGINPKEKMKEDKVESSADDAEDEGKPNEITYDDPDFNDFDTFRAKDKFQAGQIWASYDDKDGMPRFYALIKNVTTRNFKVKYVWLEAEEDEENETGNLPVSVGRYRLGEEQNTNECSLFSHLMVDNYKRSRARYFTIFPKKGEIWALFKNWNIEDSDSPREYEFVEILSDLSEGSTISVGFLSKVNGFSCVFCPMPKDTSDTFEIPPNEFFRFSHSIPSFKLKGTEGEGVTEGWYELDPAALPNSGSKNPSGEEAAQNQDHHSPPSRPAC